MKLRELSTQVWWREFISHLIVFLVWVDLVIIIRWKWDINALWLWLGGLVGTFLFDLDHLIYIFFVAPQEQNSLLARNLLLKGKIGQGIGLLASVHYERLRLPLHNAFSQIIIMIVCFWVLTSTNLIFAKGMVMAMALHLLKDEMELIREDNEKNMTEGVFWPVRAGIGYNNMKIFVFAMLGIFVIMNILLIK